MRLVIVTDAWFPQINGVVRTLSTVVERLRARGHEVLVIEPTPYRTIPCPSYPEIELALWARGRLTRAIDAFRPQAIHIATEGPLGQAASRYCRKRGLSFTTSFHTKFPEYVHARFRVPVSWGYAVLRRFHGHATRILVATRTVERELGARGFSNIVPWTRGVDLDLFRPRPDAAPPPAMRDLERPVFLNVGRVAVEKNLPAFLGLDLPGTKVVVGDGPQRAELAARYPDVVFAGAHHGEPLAAHFAAADAFVFPSLTDTFGLVLIEALASGLPVAAFPVTGPVDVVGGSDVAVLDDDLGAAARRALDIPPEACRAFAAGFTWDRTADMLLENLEPFAPPDRARGVAAAVPEAAAD